MNVRVVRFTGVSPDRMQQVVAEVEGGDPPEGVVGASIEFLYDAAQSTCVVIQRFSSAEDMAASAKVLEAMPASETPGTRASVDTCEVKLSRQL